MKFTLQKRLFLMTIIFLNINVILVYSQCLGDQQSLLLQLKNNLTFDPASSQNLLNWNQSNDCCSWDGITCSEGRVIGLNLSSKLITGGLDNSSSLFSLQYLQSLSLAYNNFNSSQIPSGFDKLTNLSYLNLSNAGFGGQIPIEISRLTRLVALDLSTDLYLLTCALKLETLNLATLVRNLSELVELHLDGVNLSAHGNEWCKALSFSMPNLKVLSLSNCYLSGPIDSSLLKLQSLSIIRLNKNNFSAPVPDFFGKFTNLISLYLSSSGLNGIFPKKIFQVPTLQTLDLSYNILLHGYLPEFLENASLQTLVLSYTAFSGLFPGSIGNLKMLSRLELSSCNFSGSIPSSMANLAQLVYLDMSLNNFNGSILSFNMAKNLTQINLSQNHLTGQINSTFWEELQHLVILDLRYNSLNGSIPASLFSVPALQKLKLSNNQFSGQLKFNASSFLLDTVDLSSNRLEGSVPKSVFDLRGLKLLSLSSNNFNGSFQLHEIQQLRNLSNLDLSYNSWSIEYQRNNSSLFLSPQITTLKLSFGKLKTFPDFLRNQSGLTYLDLSDNEIHGEIPSWIWKLSNLQYLNLSYNNLVTLQGRIVDLPSMMSVLDLRSNQLQGQLPVLPKFATILDFSRNNFSSSIPASIGDNLTFAHFFSLSSNYFRGSIPESICNASNLEVLDLSDNSFSGEIPLCLYKMNLGVLNLRRNNLNDTISDTFPVNCGLHTLDLSGNILGGVVPKSLANCKSLEVLALGDNQIKDKFPCHLKKISRLRVLDLPYNKFYGSIGCLGQNATWPILQIVDVASNNFSGKLPKNFFKTCGAMMAVEDKVLSGNNHLQYEFLRLSGFYYLDGIRVTMKGLDVVLLKILTIFTSIDVSCNNLSGPIPEEIGALNTLVGLNLSHNALTGQIPPSLGNLTELESLDLSWNNLNGEIPTQLANLYFISFLDLSFNHLEGEIPTSTQLQTFSAPSFEGNTGLCGPPLTKKCIDAMPSPLTFEETHSNHGVVIAWKYISVELGFVFGLGIVIFPLMFWKRWRIWYYNHVDDILFRIFPVLYLGKEYCVRGRRVFRNWRLRH